MLYYWYVLHLEAPLREVLTTVVCKCTHFATKDSYGASARTGTVKELTMKYCSVLSAASRNPELTWIKATSTCFKSMHTAMGWRATSPVAL